jgi:cytochrome c1
MNFQKAYVITSAEWYDFIYDVADILELKFDDISDLTDEQMEQVAEYMESILEEDKMDYYIIIYRNRDIQIVSEVYEIKREIEYTIK